MVAMREGTRLRKDRSKAKSAGVSGGPPGLSILEVAKQKESRSEGEREWVRGGVKERKKEVVGESKTTVNILILACIFPELNETILCGQI